MTKPNAKPQADQAAPAQPPAAPAADPHHGHGGLYVVKNGKTERVRATPAPQAQKGTTA